MIIGTEFYSPRIFIDMGIAIAYCEIYPEQQLRPTGSPLLWWCESCASCHSIAGMSPKKNKIVYE